MKSKALLLLSLILPWWNTQAEQATTHATNRDYAVIENSQGFSVLTASTNEHGGLLTFTCLKIFVNNSCFHAVYFPNALAVDGDRYDVAMSVDGGEIEVLEGLGFDDKNITAERMGFNSSGILLLKNNFELVKQFARGRTVTLAVTLKSGEIARAVFSLMGYTKSVVITLRLAASNRRYNQGPTDSEFARALRQRSGPTDNELRRALSQQRRQFD